MIVDETESQREGQDHVWLTRTLTNPAERLSFVCDQQFENSDEYVALMWQFKFGESCNINLLPKVMWPSSGQDDKRKLLPHIFSADGFLAVSEQMADVLRRFNLGQSKFVPVQFIHSDRKTPFPGTHYFFHIQERKLGFDPDHSLRFEPKMFDDQTHTGTMPIKLRDGDIAVNPTVREGADVWKDYSLLKSLFFSAKAMTAMRDAKLLNDKMIIAKCPIVRIH